MVFSQNYIIKMAIFDQKYRDRKKLSYREFKHIVWKWHGMWTKMAAWMDDFDFGVHKNHPSGMGDMCGTGGTGGTGGKGGTGGTG